MSPTIFETLVRGAQSFHASTTLDNINISRALASSGTLQSTNWIELLNNKSATFEQIYRTQPWVHTSVNKLARGIARLPLPVYLSAGEPNERERMRDGPLADLMRKPYQPDGSPYRLKETVVSNVAVHGNCIAVKMRPGPGRPPVELLPSSFAYWRAQEDSAGRLDYWVFNGNKGVVIPFYPEEVVHFRWWATGRGHVAPSPMEALGSMVKIEDAAWRTLIASYQNGVRPVGAVSVDQQLKKESAERMRDQLQKVYGGVDNAFKLMLMEGGAKWVPFSQNMVDAEIVNTLKLTREQTAAIYDIPPPIIGILDRATFSNVTEQHRMLYQDTLGPWLTMIEETLQSQLIDQEPMMAGQYVEFNLNEVLKGDFKTRSDAARSAVGGPWMTVNEWRARENLPPVEGGDELYSAANTAGEPLQGAGRDQPAAMLAEARCPQCNKLLAKNISVGAVLYCPRCKQEVAAEETASEKEG